MNVEMARESPVVNPWSWVAAGFLTCVAAAIAGRFLGPVTTGVLAVVGLFLVGVGLTIRLNSYSPPYFANRAPASASMIALGMAIFQIGVIGAATWSLIAALAGFDPLAPNRNEFDVPPPLRAGLGVILWLVVAPMALAGLRGVLSLLASSAEWTASTETAAMLMPASLATLSAGFALAPFASSLTLFLGALTAVLAVGASYFLVSLAFRRIVLSAVILLHFFAIINATLAAPPSSWLMGQLWTRISRPYLEFMYLNNAYHFYSPDPGPASYLWFRVFYHSGSVDPDTNEPKLVPLWIKVPDIDEAGNHRYRVALEYQRHLSLTEQVIQSDPTPPLYYRGPDGKMTWTPMYASRIMNSPDGEILKREWKGEVVGKQPTEMPKFLLSVPFHQFIPNDAQYQKPSLGSQRMIEAYVRHVARMPHPTRPMPVHSIKVYRVSHAIPPWNVYVLGMEPTDPEFYRPFYMGEHTPDGRLIDPGEPLLYWLLPILRDNPTQRNSPIKSYAAMHAGDPLCVFMPNRNQWVEFKEERK